MHAVKLLQMGFYSGWSVLKIRATLYNNCSTYGRIKLLASRALTFEGGHLLSRGAYFGVVILYSASTKVKSTLEDIHTRCIKF